MKIRLWEGQNSGCDSYWRFWGSQCEIRGLTSEFLTVSDNRWGCGRAKFQGNPASKTNKTSSPFHDNIVLEILDHKQTSNQFDTVDIYMPSIGDSWPVEDVTKNIFSTNNTFHLIIMMTSVVLCKINEEINYVSIFHNHVVRIWLHNRPAKLSWNRSKNS